MPNMKALVYNGPWDMTLEELPVPEPKAGEVRLRITDVGICGSDVHGFTGESGRRTPGMVMGHEVAGTVDALGEGVTEPAIGSCVTLFNIIAETPPSAEEGDASFLSKQVIGVNLSTRGAMAEYLAVPAVNALPIPDGMEPEVGLLAEPLAVVNHGWNRLADKNIKPVCLAVVGAGTIGLSAVLLARHHGVGNVAVLDTIAEKADRGKSFGAHPVAIQKDESTESITARVKEVLGGRPDVIIDAVGSRSSFTLCATMVADKGAVLLIGNLAKEVTLELQNTVSREVSLVGSYGFDMDSFAEAVDILPSMEKDFASFIEDHCSLEDAPQMMTDLAKGDKHALKVVIKV